MNRPGAAVAAVGALLALLGQGTATAQEGDGSPREVSGGYASWAPTFGASAGEATVTAEAPAVRGSGGRTWFPVDGGRAVPGAGDVDVDLDGSIRLGGAGTDALTLSELRLRLDGGTGSLRVRAERAGESGELTLADIGDGATAPTVRRGGATWSGLRVSLTAEGAELLAGWSGRSYAAGGELAPLDVTVGTGTPEADPPRGGATDEAGDDAPAPAPGTDDATDVRREADEAAGTAPSAVVEHTSLAAGAEQKVTGEGFDPGEVLLVAIDDDTRYQAVADGSGRVARAFPVYDTATEGAHTVELYSVTGERKAGADFTVLVAPPFA